MSLVGVLGLFRAKPAGGVGAGGRMSLADHFRELRARLLRSLLVLVLATIVAFFFYNQLIDLIVGPYNRALAMLGGKDKVPSEIVLSGIGAGLMLQLKLCATAGLVVSSPVWLYQIWAFVLPGLHARRAPVDDGLRRRRRSAVLPRRRGRLLHPAQGPAVADLAYPGGVPQPERFDDFFTFILRMLLVFGISFEIPFFVVLLNLAGVVSGQHAGQYRAWIIVGTFVFAAVATPSTDPFSMLLLAVPMCALFVMSEVIARLVDRRRARASTERWDDDAASPL